MPPSVVCPRSLRLLAAALLTAGSPGGCTADNPDYTADRDLAVPALDGPSDALAATDTAAADQAHRPDAAAAPDLIGADLVACGGSGQACCGGDQCIEAGTTCSAGLCTACGGAGQPCCVLSACAGGNVCRGNTCMACGGAGQPCCGASVCDNNACCDKTQTCIGPQAKCSTGDLCQNGQCAQCGGDGRPCCKGGLCNGMGACCAANTCVPPRTSCGGNLGQCQKGACVPCGNPGQPCCADACNDGGCCNAGVCVHSGRACSKGVVCVDGQCNACGGDGQPCCLADGCTNGGCCTAQKKCVKSGDSCGDGCSGGNCGTCNMGRCTLDMAACGGVGDPCCVTLGPTNPNFCAQRAASCRHGIPGDCEACGMPGQTCCDGNFCDLGGCCDGGTCVQNGNNCNKGQCVQGSCGAGACGSIGQLCCGSGQAMFCTAPDSRCDNSACQACGGRGEPACIDAATGLGIYCDPPYRAMAGKTGNVCQ